MDQLIVESDSLPEKEATGLGQPLSRRDFLKVVAGVGVGATGLFYLAGCAPAAAPAKKRLSLTYGGPIGGESAQWPGVVAIAKGFYEQEDLEVTVTKLGVGDMAAGLSARKVDIGVLAPTMVIANVSQAGPLKYVAAAQFYVKGGRFDSWYCSLPDSGITKFADLKGKTINIWAPASGFEMIAKLLLKRQGMDPEKDVQWVGLPFDQSYPGLKTKRADASIFIEPFFTIGNKLSKQEYGKEMNIVFRWTDLMDNIVVTGLASPQGFIDEQPEAIRRFLRGYLKALEWGEKNHDEVRKILAQEMNIPYEQIKDIILSTHKADGKMPAGFLKTWQELVIEAKALPITQPIPEEKLTDLRF